MKVVVVGGGISGLAAAHRLITEAPDLDVEVLEAGARPGGALWTERTEDGYVIERGPDSILSEKPAAVALARRVGIEGEIVSTNPDARGAYVVNRGRLERVPGGFSVVAPAAWKALARSPVLSSGAKLRAGLDLLLPRGTAKPDESLASFVGRRFGTELLERLAQPMASGIYGATAEQLSLRATMPRFLEMESEHRSVALGLRRRVAERAEQAGSGARYGLFVSFRAGIGRLPEAVAEALGDRVHTDAPARAIERQGERWQVITDARRIDADAVVVALPARPAANLLAPLDAPLAAQLRAIRQGSAATATFAWRREDVPHPLDASGFVVPVVERRSILASTWASVKWPNRAPEDRVLIRVFLGGASREEVVRFEDEELLAMARRELHWLMGIDAPPLLTRVDRYVEAMPQYHVGHLERVITIEGRVSTLERLELACNSCRGVGIPDSIASGERAADAVLASLGDA